MRSILGCVAVLVLSAGVISAADPLDWKKLQAKWELVKTEAGRQMTLEFTEAKGVVVMVGDPAKAIKIEGKYEIPDEKSNKLNVNLKFMNEDIRETLTVTKLTADELTTEDSKGKVEMFKKKK